MEPDDEDMLNYFMVQLELHKLIAVGTIEGLLLCLVPFALAMNHAFSSDSSAAMVYIVS